METSWLSESLSTEQFTGIVIVAMSLISVTFISLTGIIFGVWRSLSLAKGRAALTHQLLERGMASDEIQLVLAAQHSAAEMKGLGGPSGLSTSLPCASQAVVESGGEWTDALILEVGNGRYYVHHVEHDHSEDEWVPADRVRFPAGSPHASDLSAYGHSHGVNGKGPMVAEV